MKITTSVDRLLALTGQIVIAHVGHNDTPIKVLPKLINDVYSTLAAMEPPPTTAESSLCSQMPTQPGDPGPVARQAQFDRTATDDLLVCLECGVSMKMLKRHLITVHGLTPDQYRAKWNLPSDDPMVAANYAKLRSSLAKESGLGLRPEARPKRARG